MSIGSRPICVWWWKKKIWNVTNWCCKYKLQDDKSFTRHEKCIPRNRKNANKEKVENFFNSRISRTFAVSHSCKTAAQKRNWARKQTMSVCFVLGTQLRTSKSTYPWTMFNHVGNWCYKCKLQADKRSASHENTFSGLGRWRGMSSKWECNRAFPVKNKGNESYKELKEAIAMTNISICGNGGRPRSLGLVKLDASDTSQRSNQLCALALVRFVYNGE